jgi:hypothetical protein
MKSEHGNVVLQRRFHMRSGPHCRFDVLKHVNHDQAWMRNGLPTPLRHSKPLVDLHVQSHEQLASHLLVVCLHVVRLDRRVVFGLNDRIPATLEVRKSSKTV